MLKKSLTGLIAVLAGCASTGTESSRIVVAEPNDLGAVALEIERFQDHGDVFELRALDAADAQVALVHIRRGMIDELPALEQADAFGSEIQVEVGAAHERAFTRDVKQLRLGFQDPAILKFMALPTVSSTLDREQHVAPPVAASGERAFTTYRSAMGCNTNVLLSSVTAGTCCQQTTLDTDWATYYTVVSDVQQFFILTSSNANYNNKVTRSASQYGACKTTSGASCSGTACDSGPQGFFRSTISGNGTYSAYNKMYVDAAWYGGGDTLCYGADRTYSALPDVTGPNPANSGCCSDSSGPCNMPGKPACSACGGNAGQGVWDY